MPDTSMLDAGPGPDSSPGDDASDASSDSALDSEIDSAGGSDASDASDGDVTLGDAAGDGSGDDDGGDAATDGGATDAADAADAAPGCSLTGTWVFNEDALALMSGDFTCGFQSGCTSQSECGTSFLATSTDLDAGPGIDWYIAVPGNICNDYPSNIDSQDNFTGSADDCEVNGVATLTGQIDLTTCTVTGTIHYIRGGGGCEYTITYDGSQ